MAEKKIAVGNYELSVCGWNDAMDKEIKYWQETLSITPQPYLRAYITSLIEHFQNAKVTPELH